MDKVRTIAVNLIIAFIAAVLGFLSITSINSTVYMTEYENLFFTADNPIMHFAIISGMLIVMILARNVLKRHEETLSQYKRYLEIALLIIYASVLFIIAYKWRLIPTFDQMKVYNIAAKIVNYDFSDFLPGGYGEKWTNQWGYILMLSLVYRIFGIKNMLAIEIINIIFIILTVLCYYKIADKFIKIKGTAVLACLMLYIPLWTYFTFVYGNIPSQFFCVLSLYFVCSFCENNNPVSAILLSVSVALSVLLKTTSLVFMIAIIVYLFISMWGKEVKLKTALYRLAAIIACLMMVSVSGKATHLCMEKITGMKLSEGVPRIAHIAMSMHESGTKVAGWYDGYIDEVYIENQFDYEKTSDAAMADLKKSLNDFANNPTNALGFFTRKINSVWTEPTHESIFILLNRNVFSPNANCRVNELMFSKEGSIWRFFCNIIQSIIFIGAFFYYMIMLFEDKSEYDNAHLNKLFAGILFVGYFLFYLIWEANSQYTLFPMFILVPCALAGFRVVSSKLEIVSTYKSSHSKAEPRKISAENAALMLVIVLMTAVTAVSRPLPEENKMARMFNPVWGSEGYKAYLEEISQSPIKMSEYIKEDKSYYSTGVDNNGKSQFPVGRYLISPMNMSDKYLIESKGEPGNKLTIGSTDENRVILISNEKGYIFRFQSSSNVMDVTMGLEEAGTPLQNWEFNGDLSQYFQFENAGDQYYYILYLNKYALSYSDAGITIEELTNSDEQKWRVH